MAGGGADVVESHNLAILFNVGPLRLAADYHFGAWMNLWGCLGFDWAPEKNGLIRSRSVAA